jgi:hypothetical protein
VRRPPLIASALTALLLISIAVPALAAAATREPLSLYREELRDPSAGLQASARTNPSALARADAGAATVVPADLITPQLSSASYGEAEVGAVLAALEALPHGPELAQLSVLVATPTELTSICGEAVLACYFPGEEEMVVSGEEGSAGGVPRDFAIAHEYGHHVADVAEQAASGASAGGAIAPLSSGTLRWATYERVCQLTRAGRLFPGDQGAHYWEDPEEAFAETYAELADPAAAVPWQFTPLLAPSRASLEKVRADLQRPWRGPTTRKLSGELAAPPAHNSARHPAGAGPESIGTAAVVEAPPWVARRHLETPLDGQVAVSVTAPASAELAFSLRESGSDRVLARGLANPGQSSEIAFGNCGRDDLSLEVRSLHGAGPFEAIVRRP